MSSPLAERSLTSSHGDSGASSISRKDPTMGQAHDLVNEWWTCFEAGDLAAAMALCDPDVECILPGGMHLHGRDEVRAALAIHREALPDICHEVLTVVEQGKQI